MCQTEVFGTFCSGLTVPGNEERGDPRHLGPRNIFAGPRYCALNGANRGKMSKKLFVGGLSWNTDDQGLRAAFEKFGSIDEATVITDRDSGRSRGFGFVTFAEAGDVTEAIEAMNGTDLDGRTLNVNIAKERGDRQRQSHGGGGDRW